MSFDLDSYVDVAERLREFYARFPEGSIKTGSLPQFVETGGKAFVVYHAQAFRTPDDPCPADGWAWEPVPGPTQFTRDSELQNAETAAWGRAIVACGFETKKIASRQEVRNRSGVANTAGRENPPRGEADAHTTTPESPFKAPTGKRGKGRVEDIEALRSELIELVTQLGASDSLASVNSHADDGDAEWLKRQIEAAKKTIADKQLEPLPF